MSSELLKRDAIKAEAFRLGFSHCGMAPAEPVPDVYVSHYKQWIREGNQGEMHYLENHLAMRRDPRLLYPGCKTVVSLAMSYYPGSEPTQPAIAWYAQGRDYHDVLRERLRQLLAALHIEGRICVDTAPVMEKYWAWRCGIGWVGRHTQLVVPRAGSAFFLGELLLTQEVDCYDLPSPACACGTCRRCLDACPTKAITDRGIDARRCLSYLTIEHRGELPESISPYLCECFYGCDRCLRACPHLSHAVPTGVREFYPSSRLLGMGERDWLTLSLSDYQSLFRGSAVKRAKYEGLLRNIHTSLS